MYVYTINPFSNIVCIIVLCIFSIVFAVEAIKDIDRRENIMRLILCAVFIILMSFNFVY